MKMRHPLRHHRSTNAGSNAWESWQFLLLCCLIIPQLCSSIRLDCDPCIARKEYTIKAILHGTSQEDFWLEVQSAMRQAALDMGIQLDLDLGRTFNSFAMAQEIRDASKNLNVDAIIVTIPDALVQQAVTIAIEEEEKPVFGMNLGYELARELGILGFAAQDEYVAGAEAAEEFLQTTNITRALFVKNIDPLLSNNEAGLEARHRGFKEVLSPVSLEPDSSSELFRRQVDLLEINPSDQFAHVTAFQSVFENCQYDVVLLGTVASLDVATSALESNGCVGQSFLGSFDATRELFAEIVSGRVAFGVSQQPYLQAVLPVYFAALYVTTGKALALPVEERVYLSGPKIITADNVPTDTIQQCAADAFPICPNTLAPNGEAAVCACTDRSTIRIGGVLHGVTTDIFWDPVFAAAEQAAEDMGIELDLLRFGPSNNNVDTFRRMAARIKTLCEDGIDGIFVSIPSDIVMQSIERCLDLQVPVISVNAGGDVSEDLGLLNHIGMLEYSAGYGAAQRLIEAGMVKGYCLDHAPGVLVTEQRCRGFGDAITDFGGDVTYMGKFDVPPDNKAQYQLTVQEAVETGGDWAGIGILLLGPVQVEPYRDTIADLHPKAIVGSFDVTPDLHAGLESGLISFGIDQQPFLQGNMPVILLALEAYTKQSLKNHFVESGPNFVENVPSRESKICEANFFQICADRPPEDMNFISSGLLYVGYALFGLLILGSTVAAGWTYCYRNKWVVKISQPVFLYLMLCGIVLSSLSIPFLGVETGYRYLQDSGTGDLTYVDNPEVGKVDTSCMLVPWFYGLGFGITFSAIFAKIQRVKLIYLAGINLQRKRVTIRDVMCIMLVMLAIEFALLLSWQLASPYKWQRTVSATEGEFPLESVGVCESESGSWFFLGIILFHVICLIYALVLSWQTKDLNNEFAESSYLFLTVMFMFQVQCLAVPILALVQDSPDVFYFVQTVAIFCQNFTVLVLVFGPKMYKIFIGEADPSGGFIAGRTASPRTSLSRQNTGRHVGVQSTGGKRRGSGSALDAEDSRQFNPTPLTVTFEDQIISRIDSDGRNTTSDTSSAAAAAKNAAVVAKRYQGAPTPSSDLSSSYRHSTDLWTGSTTSHNNSSYNHDNDKEDQGANLHEQAFMQPKRSAFSQSSSGVGDINESITEEPRGKIHEETTTAATEPLSPPSDQLPSGTEEEDQAVIKLSQGGSSLEV